MQKKYKLVEIKSGRTLTVGSRAMTFRNSPVEILDIIPPHTVIDLQSSATQPVVTKGDRVVVRFTGDDVESRDPQAYFPSVIGAGWVVDQEADNDDSQR